MPVTLQPLQILTGVEKDRSPSSTSQFVDTLKVRFKDGFPEKIGGWQSLDFDNNNSISGLARSLFSYVFNGRNNYIVGTHSRLYYLVGSQLTNITPFIDTATAAANSLDTFYATLGSNPIDTVLGSNIITINDTAHKFEAGDTVTLSGSSAVNGIPSGEINSGSIVRTTTTNSYTIQVATNATSTGSGGGVSVVRSSGIITLNSTAHGLSNGDRVKIASASTTGGILNTEINKEFIIRNIQTNSFDFVTTGLASSSVSGGGGGSTEYFKPIAAGLIDTSVGAGYGLGLYGVGLYGVAKTGSTTIGARTWSHDRFGDLVLSCPGNQGNIYSFDNTTSTAAEKVTNAPPANYVFVSNNIVVALGYDTDSTTAKDNAISWSDQAGLTNWTTGQAGSDVVEGAGRFISHAETRTTNLLFTSNQTYTFRYIGGAFIWETLKLDDSIGILAQNTRITAKGSVYWVGENNFYMWRGAGVEVMPSNAQTESGVRRFVFNDINKAQKEKFFCWYNQDYDEMWFHYCSSASNEPNRVVRVNLQDFSFSIDLFDRTAGEYPSNLSNPYLINSSSTLYQHEVGFNDDGDPIEWHVETHLIYGGNYTVSWDALIPDNILTGNMTVNVKTKDYPKSAIKSDESYIINDTTERLPILQNGRYISIKLSGNDLDQQWEAGQWYVEGEESTIK